MGGKKEDKVTITAFIFYTSSPACRPFLFLPAARGFSQGRRIFF